MLLCGYRGGRYVIQESFTECRKSYKGSTIRICFSIFLPSLFLHSPSCQCIAHILPISIEGCTRTFVSQISPPRETLHHLITFNFPSVPITICGFSSTVVDCWV